jgi:hypothetical protein
MAEFKKAVRGETPKYAAWLAPVPSSRPSAKVAAK